MPLESAASPTATSCARAPITCRSAFTSRALSCGCCGRWRPASPGSRAQDQLPGTEATTRLELKAGLFGVNDDFDRNRYAGNTRAQFLNWSLWQNTSWDYAADTRGYTRGFEFAYVSPNWSLRYGAFLMPLYANGEPLELSFRNARGENLELALSPWAAGTTLRLLAWRNIARMGIYSEAVAIAAASGQTPNIVADDREGRRKYGLAASLEQPLADDGETGVFARLGWDDGRTESFAFAEVDRHLSFGGQMTGQRWGHADDRVGVAAVELGLSPGHRAYLAAGGSGFLLGDGRLSYGRERLAEVYYRLQLPLTSVRAQLSPDFQYLRNPGYNTDRGPVRFWTLRLHFEY
jgi:high affinity Mn2+ porin